VRAWLLIGFIAAGMAWAEETDEPSPGYGGYRPIDTRQLSAQHVSRRGAEVLKMESVEWIHGESDHFVYHFEKGFLCPQFAAAAELFYGRIKDDLGIKEDSYERKAHIFVFLGAKSWHEFSVKNKLEKWTGSLHTRGELYVQAPANQRLDRSVYVPHELTHLIVQRFVGDVPLWLNEGIAEYEGRQQRFVYMRTHASGKIVVMVPSSVPHDEFIPLPELTGAVDYPGDEDKIKTFYNESELLVHYLITKCGGTESFLKFVELQGHGLSFATALDQVCGEKFPNVELFESAFTKYATTKNRPN